MTILHNCAKFRLSNFIVSLSMAVHTWPMDMGRLVYKMGLLSHNGLFYSFLE